MEFDWNLSNLPSATFGSGIVGTINEAVGKHMPHLNDLFPFGKSYHCDSYIDGSLVIMKLKDKNAVGAVPSGGDLKDPELIQGAKKLMETSDFPTLSECEGALPLGAYAFDTYTYVGRIQDNCLCWTHLSTMLFDWLNKYVVPVVDARNRQRVQAAIPTAPVIEFGSIMRNVYILESESACKQGTCFHLRGVGLITCQHVLAPDLCVFRHDDISNRFPVSLVSENPTIDIAVISARGLQLDEGLTTGSSDGLNQLDHIAVVGYPNYRLGDSGSISPGVVTGFRTISGIRRILLNAPIIAGNSGGPVLNSRSQVIGVAVTGADRMEEAFETEHHSVVPIEALTFLKPR
jgi:hypothetical protein